MSERPSKRQRTEQKPPAGAVSPSDGDLSDTEGLWAGIEGIDDDVPASKSDRAAAALVPDGDDEEDLSHLLDLEAIAPATETTLDSAKDIETVPAGSGHNSNGTATDGVSHASLTSSDIAAQALQNLQEMLATAAAEAEVKAADEEDELLMSEDEILDEELESGDEADARDRSPTCSTCGASFADVDALSRHLHSHIKPPAFICEGCGRVFARQDGIKRHTAAVTASAACREASIAPNSSPDVWTETEHARLLDLSLGIEVQAAFRSEEMKRPPSTKRPAASKSKKTKSVTKKEVPLSPEELAKQAEMEKERNDLKPAMAILKAAHVSQALAKVVAGGMDVKEVFRLAGVTAEQAVLLHFAFSEIVSIQDDFLRAYAEKLNRR